MIVLIERDRDINYAVAYITVPCTTPKAPTATNRWQNIKK